MAVQKEHEENYESFTERYTEERYVIASTSTGEVLDDAQGYGCKSKRAAMRAWKWKNIADDICRYSSLSGKQIWRRPGE